MNIAKNEEKEKFQLLRDEKNQLIERRMELNNYVDITVSKLAKITFQKDKEIKEIKEAIIDINKEIQQLEKKKILVNENCKAKRNNFNEIINELNNELAKANVNYNNAFNEVQLSTIELFEYNLKLDSLKNPSIKETKTKKKKRKKGEERNNELEESKRDHIMYR